MPTIKLSNAVVAKLPHPVRGQVIYYSDSISGLGVRVTPTSKTFVAESWREGKKARFTIGPVGQLTLDTAKTLANELFDKLYRGADPRVEKRKEAVESKTLHEVFTEYLAHSDLKPRTLYDYRRLVYGPMDKTTKERNLAGYLSPLLNTPIAKITREMVRNLDVEVGEKSPAQANYSMRLLRSIFYYAMDHYRDGDGQPIIPDNPVSVLRKGWFKVGRKQTLVRAHQLKLWFTAVLELKSDAVNAKTDTVRDLLIAVLLTGLRRGEAASLTWSDIDLKGKILTVRDTKNRDIHTLPMGAYLHALLTRRRRDLGMPNGDTVVFDVAEPKKLIAKIGESSGVFFSMHDLRRSFSTFAEGLDVGHYALKRLLNHRVKDVTGGYVQIDVERLREPMQRIEDFVLKSAGVKAAKSATR
jgi:integrase